MNDEFYIGYLDESPPGLARHTRRIVLLLALLVATLVTLAAARQNPAEPGTFEFGIRREFTGVLQEFPLPTLRHVDADGTVTNYLLVGSGKHGLPAFARGHDGERVRFEGSLIQTGRHVMIELNAPESFRTFGPPSPPEPRPPTETIGDVVLVGEIVDTKCYFGVMRPATGKVHRACAVRCLSGGVPPGLLLRDGAGGAAVVLLTGPDGKPAPLDPQWAARIARIEGRLTVHEGEAQLAVRRLRLAD